VTPPRDRPIVLPSGNHIGFRLQYAFAVALGTTVLALLPSNLSKADQAVRESDPMPAVRYSEGVMHGFLTLHNLQDEKLADGDMLQAAQGDRVSSRLVFHFADSSLHEETVVFSQRRRFRLLRYHLIQKGPSFKQSIDFAFDSVSGQYSFNAREKQDEGKVHSDRMQIPPNTANGMLPTLLKNVAAGQTELVLPMLAPLSKPRLVKLLISTQSEEWFTTGNVRHKAICYLVKVHIGGLAGVVAPILDKQPEDTRIWIAEGDSPTFVKSEGPLYAGGPVWRIELSNPNWNESKP
jgi:hypothetical protein